MTSLMILEPHCSGHHMQWVRWIAREALSQGHSVRLVTQAHCLKHPLYFAMQRECEGRIKATVFPYRKHLTEEWAVKERSTVNLIRREFIYYKLFLTFFQRLPKDERPNLIFVPYLDSCAYAVGLLGSPFGKSPWGGILQRPSFHFESIGVEGPASRLYPAKRRLFFRMLGSKPLRRIFTIDETLAEYVAQNRPDLAEKLRFVYDPYQFNGEWSRAQARQELEIPDDAVVLLVYGALSTRKGIDALLNASRHPDFPGEVDILLAGAQDVEVRRLLASPQFGALREAGRIREMNWFLSDEEEYMVFRAADMVWLGYRGFYTRSGVLIQAGMIGLPVVACEEGLIGWLTRNHKLGLSVAVDDVQAVVEAINTLARDRNLSDEFSRNGRKNSAAYSVENFARVVCDELHLV